MCYCFVRVSEVISGRRHRYVCVSNIIQLVAFSVVSYGSGYFVQSFLCLGVLIWW